MRDWLDHVYPGDTIAGQTTSEANKELLRVSAVCCFEKLISFSLPSVGVVPVIERKERFKAIKSPPTFRKKDGVKNRQS